MNYDLSVIEGDQDKPAIIFVQGLGMDKGVWETPDDTKILGGRFPIQLLIHDDDDIRISVEKGSKIFFGRYSGSLSTLYHDLSARGYTVITWSQKRPSAGIDVAVSELIEIVGLLEGYLRSGMIIIGHSRGGLIGRKYLKSGGGKMPKCLITLATPHKGSRMAQWADYLKPFSSLVSRLIGEPQKGTLPFTVKKVMDFLASKAVKELLPDSDFFKSIDDCRVNGVYYISIGGKDPTLVSAYRAVADETSGDSNGLKRSIYKPQRVFGIPDIFEKLIPPGRLPDEMKKGLGDGLVSIGSSRLDWADEHYNFWVNHAEILFDREVR
ncbi:MAG: hypothetical protein AABY42_10845, partial [Nitrospirota bacterium]